MPKLFLLAQDLYLGLKVQISAQRQGYTVKRFSEIASFFKQSENSPPELVVVDLHLPQLDLSSLGVWKKCHPATRILAYGAHTAQELLGAAQAQEFDVVLPRSSFFPKLTELLQSSISDPKAH